MLLVSIALALVSQDAVRMPLPTPDGKERLVVISSLQPRDVPIVCPKYGWQFPYQVLCYAGSEVRFRVYAQTLKTTESARMAARALLRLWDISNSWGFDHLKSYGQIIDVFLCESGKAGGEQGIFSTPGQPPRNAIFLFDMKTLGHGMEGLRELAHEYGHAVLPAVGGFKEPEDWGNGYLGERLFTSELLWRVEKNVLTSEDLFGASPSALASYVYANCERLANSVWASGATSKSMSSMNGYLAFMLYVAEAFPTCVGRAMKLTGGQTSANVYSAGMAAIDECNSWTITVPKRFRSKSIALPIRFAATVSGGKVLSKSSRWIFVKPMADVIRITKKST